MTTILLRTFIVYIFLICAMRLMGKRHLGELEVSELVGALLLSELASLPIEDPNVPISFAIVPIISITALEILSSIILIKFPRLKSLISSRPSILIKDGIIDQKELKKVRLSAEELLCELRQNEISELRDIAYAILEQNGKISIIPRISSKPPSCSELNIKTKEGGIMHILISNGYVNYYNMKAQGKTLEWLNKKISKKGCTKYNEVFLFTIDDADNINIIKKDEIK